MTIKFNTAADGLNYMKQFVNQMCSYVDFDKTPIVNENAILQHSHHTLNQIDPLHIGDFKLSLKTSINLSHTMYKSEHAKFLQGIWDINSPAEWKRAIDGANPQRKAFYTDIGKIFLSSKVYMKLLSFGALAYVAAVSGLFSKRSNSSTDSATPQA